MLESRQNQFQVAVGVVTIVGVVIALFVFCYGECTHIENGMNQYASKLKSLRQEVEYNHDELTEAILNGREDYGKGRKIPSMRYQNTILLSVLADGAIQEESLLNYTLIILSNENQMNNLLNRMSELFDLPLPESQEGLILRNANINEAGNNLVEGANAMNYMRLKILKAIDNEITKIEMKELPIYC